jgi:hypothetical protein
VTGKKHNSIFLSVRNFEYCWWLSENKVTTAVNPQKIRVLQVKIRQTMVNTAQQEKITSVSAEKEFLKIS